MYEYQWTAPEGKLRTIVKGGVTCLPCSCFCRRCSGSSEHCRMSAFACTRACMVKLRDEEVLLEEDWTTRAFLLTAKKYRQSVFSSSSLLDRMLVTPEGGFLCAFSANAISFTLIYAVISGGHCPSVVFSTKTTGLLISTLLPKCTIGHFGCLISLWRGTLQMTGILPVLSASSMPAVLLFPRKWPTRICRKTSHSCIKGCNVIQHHAVSGFHLGEGGFPPPWINAAPLMGNNIILNWSYLMMIVGAICVRLCTRTSLQPRLATVSFTGTNGTDTPSNTQNNWGEPERAPH